VQKDLPSKKPDGLMNTMYESVVSLLNARPKSYVSDILSDGLKRFDQWSQVDLWRVMLISDNEHGFPLRNLQA
jgi:hypothetical protein